MNQVILTGNITKEILTKDTTKGKVANFTIANNRGEIASFFDCIAFDKKAETISTYCKKGDKVLIRGELTQDRWTAQDGTSRTAIRIIANEIEFLTKRSNDEEKQEPVEDVKPDANISSELPF